MRLKNKLMLWVGIPVLLTIVFLSIFSFRFSNKMLIKQSSLVMNNYAQKYASDVNSILTEKKSYIRLLVRELEEEVPSHEKLLDKLTHLNNTIPGFTDLFMGFEDKSFIDGAGWKAPSDYDPRQKQWYTTTLGKNDVIISDPYRNSSENLLVMTASAEVRHQGKTVGVIGTDISLEEIHNLIRAIKLYESGDAFIVNQKGAFVSHPLLTIDDNIYVIDDGKHKDFADRILQSEESFFEYVYDNTTNLYSKTLIPNTDWVLILEVPKAEVLASSRQLMSFMIILGLIALISISVILFFIAKQITKPIVALSSCVEGMASYDLTLTDQSPSVIYSSNKDEIGIISRSLIKVKQTFQELISKIHETADHVSASSEELTATSAQSANTSEGVASAVDDIAQGAVAQAEDMQKGTESMEVMQDALSDNRQSIEELNLTARQVFEAKEKGLISIRELISATDNVQKSSAHVTHVISETNESAVKISSASDMIKSIADQTNLLALNAAIEAARAGESGRGFAVVAEEIRKLAEQSTAFTEDISHIVSELTAKTSEAVRIMNSVDDIISEQSIKVTETQLQFDTISSEIENTQSVIDKLNHSVALMEDIKNNFLGIIENLSALSEENAAASEEAAAAVTEQNVSMQEIADASSSLAEMAQEMSRMVSLFKI